MRIFIGLAGALFAAILAVSPLLAAERGKVTGGMAHHYPDWFKDSFLDLAEDAQEAADENKHAILFLTLNGCPYCTRMLNETFVEDRALMEKDFDTIGINIRGDKGVIMADGTELSEKEFARKVKVRFTPTTLFLKANGDVALRINGYWDPAQFRSAMAYVREKAYEDETIFDYLAKRKAEKIWDMAEHPAMDKVDDLSKVKGPLLILVEDVGCTTCAEVHTQLLDREDVSKSLEQYTFVRIDARSDRPIVDFEGKPSTQAKLAAQLGVTTTPSFIAFDEGKERQRLEGMLYSHHFVSLLDYVSGQHYKNHKTWLSYNRERTEQVLDKGINIDLSDGRAAKK